jgi:hypothetical protein
MEANRSSFIRNTPTSEIFLSPSPSRGGSGWGWGKLRVQIVSKSDAVREKLARGKVEKRRMMDRLRDTEYRGKVMTA